MCNEAKEDPCYCGVWPFVTGPNDPFWPACVIHDRAWQDHIDGKTPYAHSSRPCDLEFLDNMLILAGDSWRLRIRAHLYYYIVRAYGELMWDQKRPGAKMAMLRDLYYSPIGVRQNKAQAEESGTDAAPLQETKEV